MKVLVPYCFTSSNVQLALCCPARLIAYCFGKISWVARLSHISCIIFVMHCLNLDDTSGLEVIDLLSFNIFINFKYKLSLVSLHYTSKIQFYDTISFFLAINLCSFRMWILYMALQLNLNFLMRFQRMTSSQNIDK